MWTKRQGTVQLLDGNNVAIGTPVDVGDFTADGFEEGRAAATRVMARGRHIGMVEGDDVLVTGGFTVGIPRETLTHASAYRIWDAIHKTGAVASAVTANPIASGPWACKLKFVITLGGVTSTFVLTQVRLKGGLSEGGDYTQMALTYEGILDPASVL